MLGRAARGTWSGRGSRAARGSAGSRASRGSRAGRGCGRARVIGVVGRDVGRTGYGAPEMAIVPGECGDGGDEAGVAVAHEFPGPGDADEQRGRQDVADHVDRRVGVRGEMELMPAPISKPKTPSNSTISAS